MPEGDTIYRAAKNLRKVLVDGRIDSASGWQDVDRVSDLEGDVVDAVESRGKHLSITLQSGLVIHSHMGMTGSWHIYRATDVWQKPKRQATLALNLVHDQREDLQNRNWCIVCFTPKLIEIITATEFRRNNYLQRLGPDLMDPGIRY